VSAPAGSTGSVVGSVAGSVLGAAAGATTGAAAGATTGAATGAAAAGAADELLPANAIPAPLMSRTASALKAGWRKRAIFIVTPWY
jgi:uncharacterized protein YcfJ